MEDNVGRHIVKSFIDVIVMAMLTDKPMHGYKLMEEIHTNFGVLLSPGTLYPLLYRLQKENLIEAEEFEKKKVYRMTDEGQRRIHQFVKLFKIKTEKIMRFVDGKLV